MQKQVLFTGIGLTVAGAILIGIGVAAHALDSDKYLEELNLHSETIPLEDSFTSIQCNLNCADVTIQCSTDGVYSVQADKVPENSLEVATENGVLEIQCNQSKRLKWYYYISIFNLTVPDAEIVITVPEEVYERITVQSDVGDITVQNLSADVIALNSDCGNLQATDCESSTLKMEADTGNITAENMIASETLEVINDCGNTTLTDVDASDAKRTVIQNDVGNQKLNGGSYRNLECTNDCGNMQFQRTALLGDCALTCDIGNIYGTLLGAEDDYSIDADSDLGNVNINGYHGGMRIPNAEHTISIYNDCGNITLDFSE